MSTLVDHAGRAVRLGPEIGRGGEGAVYQVAGSPDLVAKIYAKPPDATTEAKLRALVALAKPELLRVAALPTGTLHEGGQLRGLLMPLVPLARFRPVHFLYSPAHRKKEFPLATWEALFRTARNAAAAYERLHDAGIVAGDVNHSNLLVADDADVRLIDCDSFQVRDGGRTFRCTVGVPEYTPPELQDTRFDAIDREPNHDNFGLAVLLFHLLFMGRHPFSGVFHGKGDMPLEKAIRECRFAYGPAAKQMQMDAPPLTLRLEAATPAVAGLFARAFAPEAKKGGRPRASEWKATLDAVIPTFRECAADKGHTYPVAVAACPWCELMARGAPNYFLTVTLSRPAAVEVGGPIDVEEVWKRIASFALSQRMVQRPAVAIPPPTPLPDGVPDAPPTLEEPPFSPVQGYAVQVGILCLAASLLVVWCSRLIAANLCGLFVVASAVYVGFEVPRQRRRNAMIRLHLDELDARQRAHDQASQALAQVEHRVASQAAEFAARFDSLKRDLTATYDEHKNLPARHAAARKKLDRNARQAQLEQFLDGFLISDATIEQIGPARKASLASFGVETAADVTEPAVSAVPGFGEKLCERLMKWRDSVAKGFVFDAAKGVPPAAVEALAREIDGIRRRGAERLRRGVTEVELLTGEAKRTIERMSQGMESLARELAQAEADLTVFR